MFRIGSVQSSKGKQEIIFIHLPKTAGSSIDFMLRKSANFIERPLPENKYSWWNISRKIRGIPKPDQHASALLIKKIIGSREWNNSFSFAFVRNPWDLMVSSYQYLLSFPDFSDTTKKQTAKNITEKVKKMTGFDEYINSDLGQKNITFEPGNICDWICDENQKIIVNFVGRFENLQDDWSHICKTTGLISESLPHKNKSTRKKYQDYYNEKTKDLVAKRFEWVINEFGYSF